MLDLSATQIVRPHPTQTKHDPSEKVKKLIDMRMLKDLIKNHVLEFNKPEASTEKFKLNIKNSE